MAELTREQVAEWQHHFKAQAQSGDITVQLWDELRTLCDLAIRALEQTNAAGQESPERYPEKLLGVGSAPAAPHSEPQVRAGEAALGQQTPARDGETPPPARSEPEMAGGIILPPLGSGPTVTNFGSPPTQEARLPRTADAASGAPERADQQGGTQTAPALGGVSNAELEWLHRFLNCTVFGPPPSEIQRAHHIVEQLASAIDVARKGKP